ncbi:MAG: heme-binding domain-containing protein [Bacteroidota bacterium]
MKKSGIILVALVGTFVIFVSFIRPAGPPISDPPKNIPDSVWAVIKTSCLECHVNDGNSLAKAKLNFDKWDEYSPEKQFVKAQDICEEVRKGTMPPSKFRKNNPDAVPSTGATTRICKWVNQLEK